jgi:hypothetical protein
MEIGLTWLEIFDDFRRVSLRFLFVMRSPLLFDFTSRTFSPFLTLASLAGTSAVRIFRLNRLSPAADFAAHGVKLLAIPFLPLLQKS